MPLFCQSARVEVELTTLCLSGVWDFSIDIVAFHAALISNITTASSGLFLQHTLGSEHQEGSENHLMLYKHTTSFLNYWRSLSAL